MGFDTNKAIAAIEKSKDKTLQDILDILIQSNNNNNEVNYQNNTSTNNFQKKRSMFESTKPIPSVPTNSNNIYKNSTASPSSNYKQPQSSSIYSATNPPKPLRKNKVQNSFENDSSDDDNDDTLTNEKEWERQQEIRRKNYLESLKKQKQQEQQNNGSQSYTTKPTPSTPPPSTQPNNYDTSSSVPENNNIPIIDANVIKKVIKARNHGNDLFKLGYYGEAEKSYSQALTILPQIHDLSAIISNNRAAARLKNGQYRQCLIDCNFVIERARDRYRSQGGAKDKTTTLEGGISFQWYDQLVKALHRKAGALEATMRLNEARQIYEELIGMDANDGKAKQGLKRCQSFNEPQPSPPSSSSSSSTINNKNNNFNNNIFNNNVFNSNNNNKASTSTSAFPNLDYSIFELNNSNSSEPPSKAVKEMRERQAKLAKEEAERIEKADVVDIRIQTWKKGKEKNLRALLTTLDTVLWPSVQWKGATVNELLEPRKVKICYMKAIAKVHPDKVKYIFICI